MNVNKKQLDKIEELITTIDIKSLKCFTLESTQKILIADVKPLNGLETANKTKALLFLNQDKIVRFRVITFTNKTTFNDYDNVILSVWNKNKNKKLYSGIVSFYNPYQERLLTNEFENGILTENGVLSLKRNKSTKKNSRTNGCTDWYWVTTYQDGTQISEYLYTTCNSCEEMAYKTKNDCGGGGSSAGGTGSGPKFPFSPNNEDTYDYFSPEGEHIRYQFIANIWKIILISLPDVVVKAVPESRPYLVFNWPQDQQKAVGEGFLFNYDSGSSTWTGVPATEQLIAEVIEDKIDDSKLDPCPKAIVEKLKNSTNNDIAVILKKLGANSVYTVNMKMGSTAQGYAMTQKISPNNYLITVTNDSYTNSTQLFRAAAMIHEVIHAYYHSVVDDNNYPTTNLSLNNFPALYQAYEQKIYPYGATVAQHDQMATDYVDSMAMALQEYYYNNNPVTYPFPSNEVFTDLAWGTLQEASIFQEKFKDGDSAKERILNRYACESIGGTVEAGTPKQQTAVGKPCN